MLSEVMEGLGKPGQKELPSKYFYDSRGSELFEEITRLPEYYPTRVEAGLLASFAAPWIADFGARALVELGAGNGEKTRILLDALPDGALYIPVDISAEFLREAAEEIEGEYPNLEVEPSVSDITKKLQVPEDLPSPAVFAFLGSTIGNFDPRGAVRMLCNIERELRPEDRLLLGVDLKKDIDVLHAAYNDAQGVTAEFNRNILLVLNRELGTDFDPGAFEHRAIYNDEAGRIEMHLIALSPQRVRVPGFRVVEFAEGESIRTELSTKYDRKRIDELFTAAQLKVERWETDQENWYALVVGARG